MGTLSFLDCDASRVTLNPQLKKRLRDIGMTITRTPHGEFRVNFIRGTEDTAYYTEDVSDAVQTARLMAEARYAR